MSVSWHGEKVQSDSNEIEAKLVILSESPKKIIDSLLSLSRLGSLRVESRPERRIHDRYFDTEDHMLGKQDISLRIRETNGQVLITYKGSARASEYGGIIRREVEEEWTWAGACKTLAEIKMFGPLNESHFDQLDPIRTVEALGLRIVQDRETCRRVRNIFSETYLLAEMVIDTVKYKVDGLLFKHHEIEIEAKSGEGVKTILSMAEQVQQLFPGKLRSWTHSKLATGEGVARLARNHDYADLILHKNLRPDVYNKLESVLSRSGMKR